MPNFGIQSGKWRKQGWVGACGFFLAILFAYRSVKASHVLISADGKVYLSGLRSNLSMISHGQRLKVVHDFPKYSIKVLPWLSPEVLQQVTLNSFLVSLCCGSNYCIVEVDERILIRSGLYRFFYIWQIFY